MNDGNSLGKLYEQALRTAPDRIVFGEIRDPQDMQLFISSCSSGVTTTLHAATKTVDDVATEVLKCII